MLDETSIPDTLNKYFVELGETLAREIPQSNVSPMSFLNDILLGMHFLNVMKLHPMTFNYCFKM